MTAFFKGTVSLCPWGLGSRSFFLGPMLLCGHLWNRPGWESSPVPWGPWEAPCRHWEGTGGWGVGPVSMDIP